MRLKKNVAVLDATGLGRAVARMAHEILERNHGAKNLVFVGMQTRGVVIARRIADAVHRLEKIRLKVGVLDTTLYRDDFRTRLKQPGIRITDIAFSIENRDVVLVDDVLFTGRTVRAALDALMDYGRPATIQLAVLIDRGLRELPIHADYVGKTVPTSRGEEVRVEVKEIDQREGVWLVDRP